MKNRYDMQCALGDYKILCTTSYRYQMQCMPEILGKTSSLKLDFYTKLGLVWFSSEHVFTLLVVEMVTGIFYKYWKCLAPLKNQSGQLPQPSASPETGKTQQKNQ